MRRLGPLVVVCVAIPAHADTRLDLGPIDDLTPLDTVFHLDRGLAERSERGAFGSVALGYGRDRDRDVPVAGATLGAGVRTRHLMVIGTSDLAAAGSELVRGRHRALVEYRNFEREGSRGVTGTYVVEAAVDHGRALALAPVELGSGRHVDATARARAHVHLLGDGAATIDLVLGGELGATHWTDEPALDDASRRAVEVVFAFAPTDDELPRGRIDVVHGRVEHVRIRRPIAAAGSALADTEIRRIDVDLGASSFTLHIDRELLTTLTGQAGWSWLEADTAGGRLAANMLHLRVGTNTKWRWRSTGPRSLGIALVRQPGYTPDGQRLVSERRLEATGSIEDERWVLDASGGLSWLRSVESAEPRPMFARYGSHLEVFFKLGGDIEVGGYHALAYEPLVAADPWASPRRWSTEGGAVVRWRPSTIRRTPRR